MIFLALNLSIMSTAMITAVKPHKNQIFDANVSSFSCMITTDAEEAEILGFAVGLLIWHSVSNSVGENVGAEVVGDFVGTLVENFVGEIEGNVVGASVGSPGVSSQSILHTKGKSALEFESLQNPFPGFSSILMQEG